ncbi:MAG: hypothetical protein AAFV87_16745, partial [Pseudomonadota bacterium]
DLVVDRGKRQPQVAKSSWKSEASEPVNSAELGLWITKWRDFSDQNLLSSWKEKTSKDGRSSGRPELRKINVVCRVVHVSGLSRGQNHGRFCRASWHVPYIWVGTQDGAGCAARIRIFCGFTVFFG